jgi:hypothetical protein
MAERSLVRTRVRRCSGSRIGASRAAEPRPNQRIGQLISHKARVCSAISVPARKTTAGRPGSIAGIRSRSGTSTSATQRPLKVGAPVTAKLSRFRPCQPHPLVQRRLRQSRTGRPT